MNIKQRLPYLVILSLVLLAAPVSASAQVRDDGNFFSPQTEQQLADRINDLRSRAGKKVVIETYPAIPAELRAEASAADFWDRWITSRGKAEGADVMILITRDPGHLEVGSSLAMRTSGAFTATDHRAVSAAMAPYFKAKDFDTGVLKGLSVIEERIKPGATPSRGAPAPAQTGSNRSGGTSGVYGSGGTGSGGGVGTAQPRSSCGTGGMGSLLCVGIAVIGIFLLLRRVFSGSRQMQPPPYGGQYGQPGYPPPPPGGYPYGGGGGGGGFGRGMAGGVLGGLLGGWLGNRAFGQGQQHSSASNPMDNNSTPVDPGPTSSGFDFDAGGGGGSSGSDFGGGGGDIGGGGDSGGGGDASSGSDF